MTTEESLNEMDRLITAFPKNMQEALQIGQKYAASFETTKVENVLVMGLGGSGIGGKFVSELVWDACSVPVAVCHHYDIPEWVSSRTLFIACSYSGNTEETLNALEQARSKGAEVACITSGGKLAEIAKNFGYNLILIPGGQPPRTSFGYNALQQFFVLHAYRLISDGFFGDLQRAALQLTREQGQIRAEAAAIANKLNGTIPVIYADTYSEAVAIRLRQQINENAKMLCWHHTVPEMNHNELVGWAGGDDRFSAIFIRTPEDNQRSSLRMELNKEVISKYTKTIVELRPKGNSRIERAYYLIHLSDWISQFLARENEIDPMEIAVIDELKSALSKHG